MLELADFGVGEVCAASLHTSSCEQELARASGAAGPAAAGDRESRCVRAGGESEPRRDAVKATRLSDRDALVLLRRAAGRGSERAPLPQQPTGELTGGGTSDQAGRRSRVCEPRVSCRRVQCALSFFTRWACSPLSHSALPVPAHRRMEVGSSPSLPSHSPFSTRWAAPPPYLPMSPPISPHVSTHISPTSLPGTIYLLHQVGGGREPAARAVGALRAQPLPSAAAAQGEGRCEGAAGGGGGGARRGRRRRGGGALRRDGAGCGRTDLGRRGSSRDLAEMQPRSSRGAAEMQPRSSRGAPRCSRDPPEGAAAVLSVPPGGGRTLPRSLSPDHSPQITLPRSLSPDHSPQITLPRA